MKIYIYCYTDSVGFPKLKEQRPEQSWPFILKDLLESDLENTVYVYQRGLGGATIKEISKIYERDKGYFRAHNDSISFMIFNIGVVDASPVPFTYSLRLLAKIPSIGPYLWYIIFNLIRPNRRFYQKLYSYRRTNPKVFRRTFNKMILHSLDIGVIPISIDTPVMPDKFECRSPGLNTSIKLYNLLKQDNKSILHLGVDWVNKNFLTDDGHHFNINGHKELANRLYKLLNKSLV